MTICPPDARRGSQRPRIGKWPHYVTSAAPEVIELAASAGLILDEWQQYVLTHGLGERADGIWTATKVSCWVPRQNGKGGIIEALELGWLFLLGEKLILHSAHEYKTAQEAFLRIKGLCESTPDLDRRINRYWQANGEQGIELTRAAGGARLRFVARSGGSGRGFSGDKNVLDEAQALTGRHMAAMLPTLSARPNPQLWFFGTPPEEPDAWVYDLRADGEAGAPRMAHFDWGADLDLTNEADRRRALEDIDLRYACNPALGLRITAEFVEDEAKPSGLGELFAAERLGAWLPRLGDGEGWQVISQEMWTARQDVDSCREGAVAFSLDVTPDRSMGAIAVAGRREDGLIHGEVVAHRRGTGWMVERMVELAEAHDPIAIVVDAAGPAGNLVADLQQAGLEVLVPTTREVGQAYTGLYDAIDQDRFRHIGQAPLTAAVAGASTRTIGDGAMAWSRRHTAIDICPLVAVTNAVWALTTAPEIDPLDNIW